MQKEIMVINRASHLHDLITLRTQLFRELLVKFYVELKFAKQTNKRVTSLDA